MAPIGVTNANAMFTNNNQRRGDRLADISVMIAIAPNGLCRITASAVPSPKAPL